MIFKSHTVMDKIKVGIIGYGNLGIGVEKALIHNPDFELMAIFTRRNPEKIETTSKVLNISEMENFKGIIDIMILCGGSATDLPHQGPEISAHFNTVDSFDTHADIPEYFAKIDNITKKAGTIGLISVGWDPGLFSMFRLLGQTILPKGYDYTFWGKGVSQGHSDAIRRIKGVKNAIQYTIPINGAVERIKAGETPQLSACEKHERVCFVVADETADLVYITNKIKSMPNYFVDYNTTVNFITEEEMKINHKGMPHGGFVMRSGTTGENTKQLMEFNLKLESNPEFTASVLVAYARAVYRLHTEGLTGARTVFDIPISYLSPHLGEELRKELL